jgi:quinol monooxygenase YgiN
MRTWSWQAPSPEAVGERGRNIVIIVIGSVTVRSEGLEEALRLSQQHVDRSRREPGCISHGVHIDNEDPNRLVFVERWEGMEHLEQHFRAPASGQFIEEITGLAACAPQMDIYHSSAVGVPG